MTIRRFLANFEPHHFPQKHGPWLGFDHFDPPFTMTELRQMAKVGVVELDEGGKRFRLTSKATDKMTPETPAG